MPANSKPSRANEAGGRTEEEEWKGIVGVGGHVKEKVKLKKPKGKKKLIKEITKTEDSVGNAFAVLSDDDEDGTDNLPLCCISFILISWRSIFTSVGPAKPLITRSSGSISNVIYIADPHTVGCYTRNRQWPRFYWES